MRARYPDRYFAPIRKPAQFVRPAAPPPITPQRGKRFLCAVCGSRLEVTAERVTEATRFRCCGQDMDPA
jgi:hypothetical protein